ncbi:MAG TPA: sugar ABC transporter permease [Gaiellaceae bacterium]
MLLVSPAFALICVFVLFPLAFAVYISLTDWPLIGPYHYIGLQNYRDLFSDPEFRHAVVFTFTYTAIVTPPIFLVGYGLAVLLRSNRPGAQIFRTLYFLPFVVGLTTISFMFVIELQPNSGGFGWLLSKFHVASASQAWTVTHDRALIVISLIVVWFASGLTMLILTGGMQGIPRELYEAADVDGASWWKKELRITVPLLRRSIALALIISVIGSFLAFNQFFILAQNNVSLETVVEWIYQTGFSSYRLGYATAMALFLVVIIGIVSMGQFLALRDDTEL